MRLRNIPGAREIVAEHPLVITGAAEVPEGWNVIFGNDSPIHIEIGMGKGRFIIEMAQKYPGINYIGIDRYESVMIKALQRLERMGDSAPGNLRFIRMDAAELEDFFKEKEVERIYLNFSDPWPKERHSKRRLQSEDFLKRYDKILSPDGHIEFKTDNVELFDFAVKEAEKTGWKISYISRDLHSDARAMENNIMTEYEEKFSAKGQKICKYIIYR